ncbi:MULTISPECIES: efflux RND transporter permease subunit [unclassified Achromobacter]|uniref:efflux RND transporter permease subunit n=1 Tax=unclassified Achromobacter TaxID=2626865 RepID=UPI000B518C7E|nr:MULTISPECIES: efflux RND transporter permease subunit [unclassified Achromobacter]OWT76933.1 nodulation protein [Achromobacter sp. HZ28]OWT77813.1 nodulation protein [Achromobacter sp. HZ34]
MNVSALFIRRPVATLLMTLAIAVAGALAFNLLPVAPLPAVDFPTIRVQAQMAGASPDTMAKTVAAPLEKHLGQIADVTEMTSQSSVGTTSIILQFGLDRDIEGASRDVQAAINAARADLPASLKSNPTYRKFNPAEAPVLVLALTSDLLRPEQLYDTATTVLQQRLMQVAGIGNVDLNGSSLPAVRVELNPGTLNKYGIGLEDVRAALSAANANSAKGMIEDGPNRYQLYANDQAVNASAYRDLVIAWRNGRPVQLRDVADVSDSVESLHNAGYVNGKRAVLLWLYKQPAANIVETVDRVNALLPQLRAALPPGVEMTLSSDRSSTIRASLAHTEQTLIIAVVLVVLVVLAFLRDVRATLIPAVTVPVSILGTFGAMKLFGYTLDNLSLMALTIATGFVVDDAIVVLENIARHREAGAGRLRAAMDGAREVGFTVLSMSVSLVAVFLPILLLGGLVGRLFHEFAVVLSIAIGISLLLSLTTTPMLCALLLRPSGAPARWPRHDKPGARMAQRVADYVNGFINGMQRLYERSLALALRHPLLVVASLVLTVALNVVLFAAVPKGLFPQQDSGLMGGGINADQSISFQAMSEKMRQAMAIVKADPAVQTVVGFTGGRGTNTAMNDITLKPLDQRDATAFQVMARLRTRLSEIPGAQLMMFPRQDLFIGGRMSFAQYQYTLQGDDAATVSLWGAKLTDALKANPALADVSSDQQNGGLETRVVVDRATAARYGITPDAIDATLYDAFGERQVSTIYQAQNQYHVVMELAPRYLQDPSALKQIYVSTTGAAASGTSSTNASSGLVSGGSSSASSSASSSSSSSSTASATNAATNSIATSAGSVSSGQAVSTSGSTMVPLFAFAHLESAKAPVSVNHQGQAVAVTISFNLAPGAKLDDAAKAIQQAVSDLRMPVTVHGGFAGTAGSSMAVVSTMPMLIGAALLAVYVVLGMLYESYVHPLTILSTLPSAGVGAVLALLLTGTEFTVIALIGVFLLIGIVKKNAIMMVDFAIDAERNEGLTPAQAIHRACLLRFRPIMMTTCAALLGAVPLVLDHGMGSELRRPLGISIIGGLIVSQILTLYTTPVVYLYLDRWRQRTLNAWRRRRGAAPRPSADTAS